jgi:hypothetical protein
MAETVARATYFALPPYNTQVKDAGETVMLRDYGQLVAAVADDPAASDLEETATAVFEALAGLIIKQSRGSLRSLQSGLHIALPLSSAITPEYLDLYGTLAKDWNDAAKWGGVLDHLASLADSTGPTVVYDLLNGTDPDASHLPAFDLTVADTDVAAAELNLGQLVPNTTDKLLLYGVVDLAALKPSVKHQLSWDGKVVSLPDDGSGQQQVASVVWMMTGDPAKSAPVLAIPGAILEEGKEIAEAALLYQDGDEAAFTAFVDAGQPRIMMVDDLAGYQFVPLLPVYDLTTDELDAQAGTAITMPASGGLPIGVLSASAGDYFLLLLCDDVWGNDSAEAEAVTVQTPF